MLNRSDVEAAARAGRPPYLVAPLRVDIQHHVLDALVIATVVCAVRVLVGRQDAGADWQPPPYLTAVAVGWWVFVVFFARRLYPSYHRCLEAMDTLGAELLPEGTVPQRRAALAPPRSFFLPVYLLQWPRLYLLIRLGSVVYFPFVAARHVAGGVRGRGGDRPGDAPRDRAVLRDRRAPQRPPGGPTRRLGSIACRCLR